MNMLFLIAHAGHDATGQWHWPPLHLILVNFTAALIPVSVFSDVIARLRPTTSMRPVGWWTLLYAACITPFTAVSGWYWLRQMQDMDLQFMPVHKWLGTVIAVVLAVLVWWRWVIHREQGIPGWSYLAVAALLMLAVVVQGHLGGRMTFGSESDGIAAPPEATHSAGLSTIPASMPARSPDALQWKDHLDLKD